MRLLRQLKLDATLQARNQLYAISVGVSLLVGGALAWLSPLDYVARTFPMAILFFVGGSTLLYVIAMIILEKDDGTLEALVVTPLRPREYLLSKVISLTAIAALEGALLAYAALAWIARESAGDEAAAATIHWPGPLFVLGMVGLGALHVLIGVIVVARYPRIMEALMPMGAVALVLQLPAFYFVGALPSPLVLLVPSGAPTMLIRGTFVALRPWEWAYALGYTALSTAIFWRWALRSFRVHILRGAR